MFEVKPVALSFDIDLPTCMYSCKPVIAEFNDGQPRKDEVRTESIDILEKIKYQISLVVLKDKTSVEKLQRKQNQVIKQLESLKQQLAKMKQDLMLQNIATPTRTSPITTTVLSNAEAPQINHDIVVNAHPNFIPYGLLALKNVWKNLVNIEVSTFCHSTVGSLNEDALKFEHDITKNERNPNKATIKISLIWKNTEHTEMISSPTMYVPIYGEVNIMRYLCRVGPPEYCYENSHLRHDTDAVLDICYQLLRCATAKPRLEYLRLLDNRLKNKKYFGGDSISLADLAVCSTLRRIPKTSGQNGLRIIEEWDTKARKIMAI